MYLQEEDDSLNLDFLMIQKFSQIKITAPMTKSDLPQTIEDLKEMRAAFVDKGDEERAFNKEKFLREQRRGKNGQYDEKEEEKATTQ